MQDVFGECGISQLQWSVGSVSRKTRGLRHTGKECRCRAKEFRHYTWVKAFSVSLPRGDSVNVVTSVCKPQVFTSCCAVSTASQVYLQGA